MVKRCPWPANDQALIKYHDTIWGVPVHNDRKIFEFFVLDAFQAGLSWGIIWHKRAGFARAFVNFDYHKVARFNQRQVGVLLQDQSIVRNRLKIEATINNAQRFLEARQEFGTFDKYLWQFVGGQPKINRFRKMSDIPTHSPESDALSQDLKKRGFKFVGTTICYAFMQGIGMVNDHLVSCFRHRELTD
jgi:DNA-3-methyladenine glycosylase I